MKDFRDLNVWAKAHVLALEIYGATEKNRERSKRTTVASQRTGRFARMAQIPRGAEDACSG